MQTPNSISKFRTTTHHQMNLRKSLCTLSGDDYSIISKCGNDLQNRFAAIGLFVLCIFILCFVSSYFTFTMLFQNFILGIPVSIFFSWMITNIYLLLLYTLTKNVLPHIKNERARIFSVGIRLGFICFIAIVVSKPLEAIVFSNQLSNEIATYKQEQIQKYTQITSEYFDNETHQLKIIIEKQKKLYGNSATGQVEKYEQLLVEKRKQKEVLISQMENLVEHSNYYIQSILILNTKYPACWLFTFISIVVFLIPAYLKNFLAEQSNYYKFKEEIETKLVQQEYASFKATYNILFQTNFNANKTFSESFVDAPFNTIRKKDGREFLTEDDLIAEMYNA